MQHIKWLKLFSFLWVTLLMVGCLKDTEEFNPREENIETSTFGVVLDDLNLPVENATVAYEGEGAVTDSNGIFIFSDVVIPSSGSLLIVGAPGFFTNYRSIDPKEDTRSVNIHLKSLGQDFVISGNIGGQINAPSGAAFTFPSQVFSRLNSDIQQGNVVINSGYIDPLDVDVNDQIPGGHFGISQDDEELLLEHFGTIYLDATTDAGEELTITDGKQFTLIFPIPDMLVSEAPSEISLWKLDEETGHWSEYGTASKQGDQYVAKVDEIGIWSVQQAFQYAKLSGKVKTTRSQPVERARIALHREGSMITNREWTDAEGRFTLYYPIDQYLIIDIEDECQNVLFSADQAPILGNYELSSMEIDPGQAYWVLTGFITECGTLSKGINEGYGFIETSLYRWVTPIKGSGYFSTGLFNCGDYFRVVGRDILNSKGTNSVDISDFKDKNRSYSLGVMEACR